MGSRHRKQNRLVTNTRALGAAGAMLAAAPAAVGVFLLSAPDGPAVGAESHPKPVAQEGTVVAVSAGSLTARSADGSARTYLVTPQTTSITAQGGGAGTASFGVNDQVTIVGELRDGTAVATAVADRAVSNLDGPPMESVGYLP